MSNYTAVCLRVCACGGEIEHECAFVYVPPIVFLMCKDLAKCAAYRNWIWVKTRVAGDITGLLRVHCITMDALWGIITQKDVTGKHMCEC